MNNKFFVMTLCAIVCTSVLVFSWGKKDLGFPNEASKTASAVIEQKLSVITGIIDQVSNIMETLQELIESKNSKTTAFTISILSKAVKNFSRQVFTVLPNEYTSQFNALVNDYNRSLASINKLMNSHHYDQAKRVYNKLSESWMDLRLLLNDKAGIDVGLSEN